MDAQDKSTDDEYDSDESFGDEYDDSDSDLEDGARSTNKIRGRALKYWKEYIARKEKTHRPKKSRSVFPSLNIRLLKGFIKYYIFRKDPRHHRLERKEVLPRASSIETVLKSFYAVYADETGKKVNNHIQDSMKKFIFKKCPEKFGISTVTKEKHILTPHDLDNLLGALWCSDLCNISHGRQRIQLTLFMLLHAYTGARAGVFIESGYYKGTKRCLTYKDIRLHVYYDPNGEKKHMLEVTQRFTKANADTSENTIRMVVNSRDDVMHDPVMFFLALAFADNAIKGVSSVEQFLDVDPKSRSEPFTFKWNSEASEKPVFRLINREKRLTEDAWNCDQMFHQFRDIIKIAGYEAGAITTHTLRRGFANAMERDPNLTREEKNRAMTYTPGSNLFARSYMSKICIVDGQSLFLRENPQRDHIDLLRSAARCRVTALPQSLPAQIAHEIEQSPEMIELRNQCLLKSKTEKRAIQMDQTRLRRKALKDYQDQHIKTQYHQHVTSRGPIIEQTELESTSTLNTPEKDLQALRPFMPERTRLAEVARLDPSMNPESKIQTLSDLAKSCCQDERVIYRPDERPIEGRCPLKTCKKDLHELEIRRWSEHIHACRGYEKCFESKWAQYCYRCCNWVCTPSQWTKHCEDHLESLDLSCEPRVNRYTLIQPGVCLFCLGDKALPATKRLNQFLKTQSLRNHLNIHLRSVQWPISCPHPLCDCEIEDLQAFEYHMIDVHGKKFFTRGYGPSGQKTVRAGDPTSKYSDTGRKTGLQNQVWLKHDADFPGQFIFSVNDAPCLE